MHIPRFSRPDPYGLLIFMVGVLVLCEAFVRHMPAHLTALVPFVPEGTAKRALFLIGLLLVYLSDQVARRKKNAWRLTVVLLVGLIVFTLARHFTLMQLGCYVAVLLLFVVEPKSFVVQSDPDRFRRGLFLAVAQLAGAILLMAAMFFIIDQREFGRHLTTGQTIHFTFNALIGQPLPHYVHATRYDRSLIDLLRLTGIISVLVVTLISFGRCGWAPAPAASY